MSYSTFVSGLSLIKSSYFTSCGLKHCPGKACFLNPNYTDSFPSCFWKEVLIISLLISFVSAYFYSGVPGRRQGRRRLVHLTEHRGKLHLHQGAVITEPSLWGAKFTSAFGSLSPPVRSFDDSLKQNWGDLGDAARLFRLARAAISIFLH